jgi:hypothetical protein
MLVSFIQEDNPPLVGASLFAMVVNGNAGSLTPRAALSYIASKLAPAGEKKPFTTNREGFF